MESQHTSGAQVEEVLAGGGVEADDGDFHGRTALHLAASNGHLATARRLVLGAAPADPPLRQPLWHALRASKPWPRVQRVGAKPLNEPL